MRVKVQGPALRRGPAFGSFVAVGIYLCSLITIIGLHTGRITTEGQRLEDSPTKTVIFFES